ncbi:MAG: serine/threonine-protein phosphatase [SAR324 cluster bacterium]|nr:serine/threonine-protein phosphatase [SAR324 cluster bacterium]
MEHITIFLGDSTGHGVAAALSTIMANVILFEERKSSLEQVMVHLNEVFEQHLPEERFISAILTNISQYGELKTIIAGHPPVILIPADGDVPILLKPNTTILGILPKQLFNVHEIQHSLKTGDIVIHDTDGIYEVRNSDGKMFGIEGLRNFLSENRALDLDSLITHLIDHVNSFTQEEEANDDITLIAFEYIG